MGAWYFMKVKWDEFGLEDKWLVDYEHPEAVGDIIRMTLEKKEQIHSVICDHIDSVRSLAEGNLKWL